MSSCSSSRLQVRGMEGFGAIIINYSESYNNRFLLVRKADRMLFPDLLCVPCACTATVLVFDRSTGYRGPVSPLSSVQRSHTGFSPRHSSGANRPKRHYATRYSIQGRYTVHNMTCSHVHVQVSFVQTCKLKLIATDERAVDYWA
jgi:hypothetical protein